MEQDKEVEKGNLVIKKFEFSSNPFDKPKTVRRTSVLANLRRHSIP